MNDRLAQHILHNWPLAIIAAGLPLYLLVVLLKGVFYTNQGRIYRAETPGRYWSWVLGFTILSILCISVLIVTYYLTPQR